MDYFVEFWFDNTTGTYDIYVGGEVVAESMTREQ